MDRPLVAIAWGPDEANDEELGHARGFVAIGQVATGIVAIGLVSYGVVSIGLISLGILSFSTIAEFARRTAAGGCVERTVMTSNGGG